jgi:glycosyltransferase involved in cell wall biosynthesis
MERMNRKQASGTALVLGRALHSPWNEGTRVIGRDLARAISLRRSVSTISLTAETYRGQRDERLPVDHVYSWGPYGIIGDYVGLAGILRRIQKRLAQQRVDVTHLVGLPLAIAPLLRLGRSRVITHVVMTRQMYMGRIEHMRAALAWRVFDRWIDMYACTSQQIHADLLMKGYNPQKLRMIPPPLDVDLFQPRDRVAARQQLGMSPDAFIVVYVGTVSPLRFPAPDIMHGLSLASATIPNLQMEIFAPVATHGYNKQWAEENVQRAAGEVEIPVRLQLKDLSEPEKALVYSAADVVLLPFIAPVAVEPPLTLLEAMACHAVVAVAPFANRSNIVRNGENGMLYANPEEFASRLEHAHEIGAEGRAALGVYARRTVVETNSFEAIADAIETAWSAIGVPSRS